MIWKADALLPQMKADMLVADKAFDAGQTRHRTSSGGRKDSCHPAQRNHKIKRAFEKEMYEVRHLIENLYCKLKQFRAIATRYDKTARNFLAAIHLAAAVIWLI